PDFFKGSPVRDAIWVVFADCLAGVWSVYPAVRAATLWIWTRLVCCTKTDIRKVWRWATRGSEPNLACIRCWLYSARCVWWPVFGFVRAIAVVRTMCRAFSWICGRTCLARFICEWCGLIRDFVLERC